ncbi:MAG: DUF368 domain-containing protein [Lachnospiraceae bacterium]|nr:DUF368 domain-containing protein [Lachnospiraceae bacterium]MBQ8846233.1 DUF368 domain-containing protein [Lachnospiraceae bacterium]
MTVPGVSGGTMAILVGIYDRLIGAVSGLIPKNGNRKVCWKEYRKTALHNLLFLTVFLLGAGLGMLLFAKVISGLLEQPVAGGYVRFFFLGAVAGGIPLILSSAKVKKFSVWLILLPVIGAGLVYGLTFLPEEMFSLEAAGGLGAFLLKLIGGIILAIALVLPGVSASQMLYTLGIYEELLACIGDFRIVPLIPLGIGTVLGILLITKTLDTLMTKYPKQTFLIIFGFILGSLPELFPRNAEGNYLLCGVCVAVGFLLAYAIGRRERQKA